MIEYVDFTAVTCVMEKNGGAFASPESAENVMRDLESLRRIRTVMGDEIDELIVFAQMCRKGNVNPEEVHDTYQTFVEAYNLLQREERRKMAEDFAKAMHKDGVIPVMPGTVEVKEIGWSH